MGTALAYDPADQKRRRRRARITIAELAARLRISTGGLSEYEQGKEPLPHDLDGEDYEKALLDAIQDKRTAEGKK